MTPLEQFIRAHIARHGPVTFAQFMEWAMRHPQHGYYITRDPLGSGGDFVTGPEISQMFGEMLALWCVDGWMKMGAPAAFALAEGGPGRGTLMEDMLRTVGKAPDFLKAAHVTLIEKSPALRAKQKERLSDHAVAWAETPEELPPLPLLFFANELLDTFAIHRFIKNGNGWAEQGLTVENGKLAFCPLALPDALRPVLAQPAYTQAPSGSHAEISPDSAAWFGVIVRHVARHGGAALFIDYGYEGPVAIDTVQAIRAGNAAPLLEDPGEVDITAYLDFGALRRVAEKEGLASYPLLLQRDFLLRCGIFHRVKILKQNARPDQQASIDTDLERLLSGNHMGVLFKVFCVAHPSLPPLLGFQ